MLNLDEIKMSGTDLPVSFFIKTLKPSEREIVTEAVYECLRRNWPVNRMEIGYLARELRRKQLANS